MKVVARAEIPVRLVRTWKGDLFDERKLHRRKDNPSLCPVCRGEMNLEDASKVRDLI